MKILSTKILTDTQRNLLQGFDVEEVSMIEISFGEDFEITEKIENAVFTSINSVRSVFEIHKNKTDWFGSVFCVGNKTKYLLEQQGLSVKLVADNAFELSNALVSKFFEDKESLKQISWFCGNLRNNDLPTMMAENGVLVTEYMVYQTTLMSKKVTTDFDAVLFYSPSGIRSFVKENKINRIPVVCLGSTTVTEAVEHFENVYIAEETSVESVIEKVKEVVNL